MVEVTSRFLPEVDVSPFSTFSSSPFFPSAFTQNFFSRTAPATPVAQAQPENHGDQDKYKKPEKATLVERTYESISTFWDNTWSSLTSLPLWRFSHKRFKDLSNEVQDQVLFCFATLLGTVTFLILFECIYRINAYNLEQAELVFSLSYVSAYLISIAWQHALNRWFVSSLSSAPYWTSLLQTYIVYSLSLAIIACSGALMIRVFRFSPRFVTMFTLPTSGVLNYYFLRFFMEKDNQESPHDALV